MRERGFTLIELLIVVAIIGIIAAIAVPYLLISIQRAKQKRAMGEVRSIATAAQAYSTDANIYPVIAPGFITLVGTQASSDMAPDYIRGVPNPDPWDSSYKYSTDGAGKDFGVVTYGKDGAPDLAVWGTVSGSGFAITKINCFEQDIVWVDDGFVVLPEGKQRKCV